MVFREGREGGRITPAALSDGSLAGLAETLGTMPSGDVPAAWYMSLVPEVLDGYGHYLANRGAWDTTMAALLAFSGLPPQIQYSTLGEDYLNGLLPPPGMESPPRGWRLSTDGKLLVPRKRTRAEKTSQINLAWIKLTTIPRAVDYLPGMPNTLWTASRAYLPQVRRPAAAVLVFLAADPETATPPFETGPQWTRMKVSTFHLLRERQEAEAAARAERREQRAAASSETR